MPTMLQTGNFEAARLYLWNQHRAGENSAKVE